MATTILYGTREREASGATSDGADLWIPLAELEPAAGWELKPQGLCQGETCVPIPKGKRSRWVDEKNGRLNLTAFARHLGQPIVRDESFDVWAFGEPARGASLRDPVVAPDFTLPDLDGRMHSLSDFRGKKVFLFAWASW